MESVSRYWPSARAARYSLLFALPLLLAYEGLAWVLGQGGHSGVRNGADVLLKSLFLALGGRNGLTLFTLLLLGGGAVLVIRDIRRNGWPRVRAFALMAGESLVYALLLGFVASALTSVLLRGSLVIGMQTPMSTLDLPTRVMISLGAGIYEELLFRVLLVGALALLATRVFRWRPLPAGLFAAVLGALVFSAFHYIGPYGDSWEAGSFTFRAVAGLLFSGLYLVRGFGIAAWTHAIYDLLLV